MSYDQKIQTARQIIEEHNANVDDSLKINFEDFMDKLRSAGGTSEQTLKAVSWEDLEKCGIPSIMARSLAHLFRQSDAQKDGFNKLSSYVSERKVKMMTPEELLQRYNPKDVNNTIGKRLKELSDGKSFIVFDHNGKLLIDVSLKLLEDILDGLPEVETAFVEGRPYDVYKVGERPDAYVDINPLYPSRPLRSGEICDQTGRSWEGISLDIRQLLYLAIVNTGELNILSVADASDIMDKVMSKDFTFDKLRSRYPKSSKLFDTFQREGNLPKMKMKLASNVKNNKNNPFGKNLAF